MKIVEDYAQRVARDKVEESMKQIVIRMSRKGFSIDEIADVTDCSLSFVKEILSN